MAGIKKNWEIKESKLNHKPFFKYWNKFSFLIFRSFTIFCQIQVRIHQRNLWNHLFIILIIFLNTAWYLILIILNIHNWIPLGGHRLLIWISCDVSIVATPRAVRQSPRHHKHSRKQVNTQFQFVERAIGSDGVVGCGIVLTRHGAPLSGREWLGATDGRMSTHTFI